MGKKIKIFIGFVIFLVVIVGAFNLWVMTEREKYSQIAREGSSSDAIFSGCRGGSIGGQCGDFDYDGNPIQYP